MIIFSVDGSIVHGPAVEPLSPRSFRQAGFAECEKIVRLGMTPIRAPLLCYWPITSRMTDGEEVELFFRATACFDAMGLTGFPPGRLFPACVSSIGRSSRV